MSIRTFTVRTNEVWTLRQKHHTPVVVTKATVRVAKGQKGGGQFHGATNLRGTTSA